MARVVDHSLQHGEGSCLQRNLKFRNGNRFVGGNAVIDITLGRACIPAQPVLAENSSNGIRLTDPAGQKVMR